MRKFITISELYLYYIIALFSLLSLNVFFKIDIDKVIYAFILIPIAIYMAYFITKISLAYKELAIVILFIFLILTSTLRYVNTSSVIYSLSLIVSFLFLVFVIKSEIRPISISKLRLLIRSLLFITLFFGIVSLFTPYNGWSWPVNISIQELVILILFNSLFLISRVKDKENFILYVLVFILLLFRQSGKTTLFCLILLMLLLLFNFKSKFIRFLIDNFIIFYFCISLFLLVLFLIVNKEVIQQYHMYIISEVTNIDNRGEFWKRISLIYDALYNQSYFSNFLFGTGLGASNYIGNNDLYLKNTPQILILTLQVYGGVFFTFTMFYMFVSIKYLLNRYFICYKNNINILFVVLLIFLTTHEYINNPFLYSSLSIYILVLKCRVLNK